MAHRFFHDLWMRRQALFGVRAQVQADGPAPAPLMDGLTRLAALFPRIG